MQEKISTKANMQLSNLYVVLLVLVLGVVGLGAYFIYHTEKGRTITVSGKSTSQMSNEIANFSVTVDSNDEDKQAAVEEVTTKSQSVISALKEFGIPEADLETANLNVYQREEPVLDNGVTVYKPGNWYASYNVNIKLRDITKVTELTALLTSFDKSSMWGPNLQIDNTKIDEAMLLQDAIGNARVKADAMAKKVGKRVGGVVTIAESNAYDSPYLYAKMDSAVGMGGGGVPIAVGTTEVQKNVIVTFWLK